MGSKNSLWAGCVFGSESAWQREPRFLRCVYAAAPFIVLLLGRGFFRGGAAFPLALLARGMGRGVFFHRPGIVPRAISSVCQSRVAGTGAGWTLAVFAEPRRALVWRCGPGETGGPGMETGWGLGPWGGFARLRHGAGHGGGRAKLEGGLHRPRFLPAEALPRLIGGGGGGGGGKYFFRGGCLGA